MEEEKKNELLAQLNLRTFCVGIRQMDSSKRIFSRTVNRNGIFHSYMASELLEILPGAMKKFNEIIAPKAKLLKKNWHQGNKLIFEAVSEVRSKICDERQWQNEKQEQKNKTIFSSIKSFFGFHH